MDVVKTPTELSMGKETFALKIVISTNILYAWHWPICSLSTVHIYVQIADFFHQSGRNQIPKTL